MTRTLTSALTLAVAATVCTASPPVHADTLAKIKQTGVLTIGARDTQLPFSYKATGDGDPIGFTTDICLKIAEAVKAKLGLPNLQVRYVQLNSTNRIPLIQNGSADLDCATTTNTTQRAQQVEFAPSHFVANITAAVPKDSPIRSFDDLKGRTVSTVAGSTSVQLLRQYRKAESIDVNEISGKDTADGFLLMEGGRSEAYLMDDVQLAGLIANSKSPDSYRLLTEALRSEPYGIMFRKDDPAFKAVVDETVTAMMKSGEMDRLYQKWFQSPIPPKGINLNFPMTPQVREAYRNPNNKGV